MPHEQMDEKQVAAYLGMDSRELAKLCARQQFPCRKVGGKTVFLKSEVDQWVVERMGGMDRRRLEQIEQGVSSHHGMEHPEMLVAGLLPPGGTLTPLTATSREGVIRQLIDLADRLDLVYSRDELLKAVLERERLCSTAILPSTAVPHPRHPLPYDIASSFVVAGLAFSGIPFGAEDGTLTRLFVLVCCKDERTHLHVLARLARMFQNPAGVEMLLASGDGDELAARLVDLEQSALEQ